MHRWMTLDGCRRFLTLFFASFFWVNFPSVTERTQRIHAKLFWVFGREWLDFYRHVRIYSWAHIHWADWMSAMECHGKCVQCIAFTSCDVLRYFRFQSWSDDRTDPPPVENSFWMWQKDGWKLSEKFAVNISIWFGLRCKTIQFNYKVLFIDCPNQTTGRASRQMKNIAWQFVELNCQNCVVNNITIGREQEKFFCKLEISQSLFRRNSSNKMNQIDSVDAVAERKL